MNINDAYQSTLKHFKSKVSHIPVAWVGPSGIGKTTMAKKLGQELDKPFVYLPMRTDDVLGLNLPSDKRDSIDFIPHKRLAPAIKQGAIIYVDEVNRADRYSRFALMELIGERTIGGIKLHSDTNIILTMNDESDDYDVNQCDNAFKTRAIPMPVKGDLDSVKTYAKQAGLPSLAAFFETNPQFLNNEISWQVKPDPRFVTYLCQILSANAMEKKVIEEIFAFALGKEYSKLFFQKAFVQEILNHASDNVENFYQRLK